MPRKIEQAPPEFCRKEESTHCTLQYDIELITPVAGGGTESWEVDMKNPARTQSIKDVCCWSKCPVLSGLRGRIRCDTNKSEQQQSVVDLGVKWLEGTAK